MSQGCIQVAKDHEVLNDSVESEDSLGDVPITTDVLPPKERLIRVRPWLPGVARRLWSRWNGTPNGQLTNQKWNEVQTKPFDDKGQAEIEVLDQSEPSKVLARRLLYLDIVPLVYNLVLGARDDPYFRMLHLVTEYNWTWDQITVILNRLVFAGESRAATSLFEFEFRPLLSGALRRKLHHKTKLGNDEDDYSQNAYIRFQQRFDCVSYVLTTKPLERLLTLFDDLTPQAQEGLKTLSRKDHEFDTRDSYRGALAAILGRQRLIELDRDPLFFHYSQRGFKVTKASLDHLRREGLLPQAEYHFKRRIGMEFKSKQQLCNGLRLDPHDTVAWARQLPQVIEAFARPLWNEEYSPGGWIKIV